MIRFDTPPGTMGHAAVDRELDAGTIDAFRNFRRSNTNYAPVPSFTGDYCDIRVGGPTVGAFQFRNRQFENLPLNFLSFLIASVQMLCQTPSFFRVPGAKKFHYCTRGIHSSGGV